MNKEFISSVEIADIIRELGSKIEIKRKGKDEFNNKTDDVSLTSVMGYFYYKTPSFAVNINNLHKVYDTDTRYYLFTAYGDYSKMILLGDIFCYLDKKYKIIGIEQFETAYFTFECELIQDE